jgi:hypothetical protein
LSRDDLKSFDKIGALAERLYARGLLQLTKVLAWVRAPLWRAGIAPSKRL